MNQRWIAGNDIRLLENGEGFFPRVFECIAQARQEVLLETFILFEDKVGVQLRQALIAAAAMATVIIEPAKRSRMLISSCLAACYSNGSSSTPTKSVAPSFVAG